VDGERTRSVGRGEAPAAGPSPRGSVRSPALAARAERAGGARTLRLTKHHGAGNDFLVALDIADARPFEAAEAAALCDRHAGIGADGLLRVLAGRQGAELAMELRNADGTVAETSGNGLRCLVQAAVLGGLVAPGEVRVATGAGIQQVRYVPGEHPGLAVAAVDMGMPSLAGDVPLPADLGPDARAIRATMRVSMGNPHVVLLLDGPPERGFVGRVGPMLDGAEPHGANVEAIWPLSGGELAMAVWERGVGETLACGTGTCAAAAAACAWGVSGARVVVRNPGGSLEVALGPDGAVLRGPTQLVGRIEVDEAVLSVLVAARRSVPGLR